MSGCQPEAISVASCRTCGTFSPWLPRGTSKYSASPSSSQSGDARHDRVEIAVGDFVPQIFGHPISPIGIDFEPGIGLDEHRAAVGKIGIVRPHVAPADRWPR